MDSQSPDEYPVVRPSVHISEYWLVFLFLGISILTPTVFWFISHNPVLFGRSGSLMVLFAAAAEFALVSRANAKHILNACRAKDDHTPWDFSRQDTVLSIIVFLFALVGTFIWGFGDLVVGRWQGTALAHLASVTNLASTTGAP